jgi:arginine exporter protein ArgO
MSGTNFSLFLAAALIIAAVPGPGIFYVAARTLSGGRKTGIASTFGTALGGLVHVVAGALGVSAIILASAELFTALKFAGALYLIWLGVRTFREAGDPLPEQDWQQLVEAMKGTCLDQLRIAHVKPLGLQSVEYCELFALEAGMHARVFSSEDEAIMWLRHGLR